MIGRFFSRPQRQVVDHFGAPGSGKSTLISSVTIVILLGGWWAVTHFGLIKPLFVPSPGIVISKFNRAPSDAERPEPANQQLTG